MMNELLCSICGEPSRTHTHFKGLQELFRQVHEHDYQQPEEVRTTMPRRVPLTKMLMDRRDEVISRLHSLKRFVITKEEPHEAVRVTGFNEGIDKAIELLKEYL